MFISMFPHRFWAFWALAFSLALAGSFAVQPKPAFASTTTLSSFEADKIGGRIEARSDSGDTAITYLPSLKSDFTVNIQGDLAHVRVVQNFANPSEQPMHATYLFPLNEKAAVHRMVMEVGEERVEAVIRKKEQAKREFEAAKQEGKSAALLQQHRPNMFTQDIANLMPGLPITVTLEYVQPVPRIDGAYELVLPLVVGPRYQPATMTKTSEDGSVIERIASFAEENGDRDKTGAETVPLTIRDDQPTQEKTGEWNFSPPLPSQYPPVSGLHIPDTIDRERVSIAIELDGGMPIRYVESKTHPLDQEDINDQQMSLTLADGRTIDNRDFVLRYALGGEGVHSGLYSTYDSDQGIGYFSLLIEPPAVAADTLATPREMVFVLDCSGSMHGAPMSASKAFMRAALQNLRPSDTFRIIRFSDAASEFSSTPLPATPENIQKGLRYTNTLSGTGGTEMTSGVRQAMAGAVPAGRVRLVFFLTDGYIGNETEVLRLVREERNGSRLFALGVGAGVNRYLLEEMGRTGQGFVRYLDPTSDVLHVAAKQLATRMQTPVMTDIAFDWGKLDASKITPTPLPDLFAGDSLRIHGRYTKPGDYEVRIQGLVGGQKATLPLHVNLSDEENDAEAVALTWARTRIADYMHQLNTPRNFRQDNLSDSDLRDKVTELGLEHSLVTQWTSFVAVSRQVYNHQPEQTETRPVPLHQVAGVSALAYPKASAPEPPMMLGLLLMLTALGWFMGWRRRG